MLYGGHGGVAIYMYRFRLCIYTDNKGTCIYVIVIYMCYTVDTEVSQYTCIGLGYVYTPTVEYVYISYRDVHVLCGGHGGVAAYMYRLGYVYTLILE